MPNATELQNRVDHLESLLRDRDAKEAAARAEELAKRQATESAADAAARVEAAAIEREQIRKGSWTSHLIQAADPSAPLDLIEIGKSIPADGSWPPGTREDQFTVIGKLKPEDLLTVEQTTLGKMLAALTPRI
jgi:hypothetical protein